MKRLQVLRERLSLLNQFGEELDESGDATDKEYLDLRNDIENVVEKIRREEEKEGKR